MLFTGLCLTRLLILVTGKAFWWELLITLLLNFKHWRIIATHFIVTADMSGFLSNKQDFPSCYGLKLWMVNANCCYSIPFTITWFRYVHKKQFETIMHYQIPSEGLLWKVFPVNKNIRMGLTFPLFSCLWKPPWELKWGTKREN